MTSSLALTLHFATRSRLRTLAISATTSTCLLATTVFAQGRFDAMEFWRHQELAWRAQQQQHEEFMNYLRGNANFMVDWSPTGRVAEIIDKLQSYSGMHFTVVPAQTFQWGQSHQGGVILLDISTVGQGEEHPSLFAYKLAHEWGHEAIGHQPSYYNPSGNNWSFRMSPAEPEHQADDYAGRFLAEAGYDLDEVVAYLENLPPGADGDISHGSGKERAEIVTRAFKSRKDILQRTPNKVSISVRPWQPGMTPVCVGIWVDQKFVGVVWNSPTDSGIRTIKVSAYKTIKHSVEMRALTYNWHPQMGWYPDKVRRSSQRIEFDPRMRYIVHSKSSVDLDPELQTDS